MLVNMNRLGFFQPRGLSNGSDSSISVLVTALLLRFRDSVAALSPTNEVFVTYGQYYNCIDQGTHTSYLTGSQNSRDLWTTQIWWELIYATCKYMLIFRSWYLTNHQAGTSTTLLGCSCHFPKTNLHLIRRVHTSNWKCPPNPTAVQLLDTKRSRQAQRKYSSGTRPNENRILTWTKDSCKELGKLIHNNLGPR